MVEMCFTLILRNPSLWGTVQRRALVVYKPHKPATAQDQDKGAPNRHITRLKLRFTVVPTEC